MVCWFGWLHLYGIWHRYNAFKFHLQDGVPSKPLHPTSHLVCASIAGWCALDSLRLTHTMVVCLFSAPWQREGVPQIFPQLPPPFWSSWIIRGDLFIDEFKNATCGIFIGLGRGVHDLSSKLLWQMLRFYCLSLRKQCAQAIVGDWQVTGSISNAGLFPPTLSIKLK